MLLKESDWEFHVESEQKLWFAKGEEAGFMKAEHERAKSLVKNVEAVMHKFHLDLTEACETLDTSVEEYEAAKKKLSNPT